MRLWIAGALPFFLLGCLDVSLPPLRDSRVRGRIVIEGPPSRPVVGAGVTLRTTGRSTLTDDFGFFDLGPVDSADDFLDLAADTDGDGAVDRRRAVLLASRGVRSGRVNDLGDLPLREAAVVSGTALRGDEKSVDTHLGTTVFVPGQPFVTTTSDPGSFVLTDVPEGDLTLSFFRPGYRTRTLTGLSLQPGQFRSLAPLSLAPLAGTPARGGAAGGCGPVELACVNAQGPSTASITETLDTTLDAGSFLLIVGTSTNGTLASVRARITEP